MVKGVLVVVWFNDPRRAVCHVRQWGLWATSNWQKFDFKGFSDRRHAIVIPVIFGNEEGCSIDSIFNTTRYCNRSKAGRSLAVELVEYGFLHHINLFVRMRGSQACDRSPNDR